MTMDTPHTHTPPTDEALLVSLQALGPSGELDLDFTDRVMARVRESGAGSSWWSRLWARGRRPVSPRSSLLAAVPVVVGVVVITLFAFRHATLLASQPAASPLDPASDLYPVEFRLAAPEASRVHLAGDFNRWRSDTIALADADGDGVWTVTVALGPGRHAYYFVVDGKQRVVDPRAEAGRGERGPCSIVSL
jgi:hypothetical protein